MILDKLENELGEVLGEEDGEEEEFSSPRFVILWTFGI
jgi:fructose/tagatose bisphosphate aldolase